VSDAAITVTGLARAFSAILALDDVDLDRRAAALRLCPVRFGRARAPIGNSRTSVARPHRAA
jgi:hypothetical protein